MRTLVTVIVLLLVLHLLAAAGFVAWLGTSGRLNQQRLAAVVDIFRDTVEQEQRKLAEAEAAAAEAHEAAARAARLEAVADGPSSTQLRLEERQRLDEQRRLMIERMKDEREALLRQMQMAKAEIERREAELAERKKAFEQMVNARQQQVTDKDFLQTVRMYENLEADQTKQMFQELIAEGRQEQVVDYIAAMQGRKAAEVLGEFETEEEIVQAKELLEALRTRDVEVMEQLQSNLAGAGR